MDITKIVSDFRSSLLVALATKFHYLIVFGIIAGLALTVVLNRPDFAIRGLIYIIPAIFIVILLSKLYKKGGKVPETLILMQPNRIYFQILFVSLFALSILALYFSSYRPWYYFLLITGLFCVVFFQIFTDNLKPSILLFEISCVMGNLIFGLQLKYPLYFGMTDIIPHLYFSKITFLSGHIIPADLDFSYAWFPLYHIFIAEGMNLFGTDEKFSFIILTSLSFIVLVWAIYLLFNQITKNNQTSLLISLFFSITPVVVSYSTYVITRTLAFIGFVFFLLLVHTQIQTSKWRSYAALTILFSLYLILVHQVSILQIVVLLILFIILELLINDYFVIKTKLLIFIIVTFSIYWLYTSIQLVGQILSKAESANTPGLSALKYEGAGLEYAYLESNISTAIIIFFVILGIGYLFWAYKSKYPSVIGLFVLCMSLLYFPSPLTASTFIMSTLRADRFSLLISPFFAFALATGFLFVLYILYDNKISRKIALIFGLLIFFYLCFSSITGDNASDSLDLSSQQGRHYFTESEMRAFAFIPQFVKFNSTISSDDYPSHIFEKDFFSETKTLNLPSYYATSVFELKDKFTFEKGFFILRNQELERNGLPFKSTNNNLNAEWLDVTFHPAQDILLKFADLTYTSQKIYDNHEVSILAN
ncbi:MAG: hypothetical protein ABSE07_09435 [Methanoregula sp.]|jgi:hypothetical protein